MVNGVRLFIPLSWLINKFAPVPEWDEPTKGIIYYTDNRLDPEIMKRCQESTTKWLLVIFQL